MWKTQCALVTGRSHQRTGTPLQDRTCVRTENGVTVACLADGAGSAMYSQEGAEAAVQQTCQFMCEHFDALYQSKTPMELKRAILFHAESAVIQRAQELGVPVQELASTLLAVAVKGDQYLIFHLGDGVIAYQKDGKVLVASTPWNGEFANSTVFITSPGALRHCKVFRGVQPKLEGFCLMSDGCEAALYDKRHRRMSPALEILFQQTQLFETKAAGEMLDAAIRDVIAARSQDDCSLVLLSRKGRRFGRWERMTAKEKANMLGIQTQNRVHRRRLINRCVKQYGITTESNGKESKE